MYLRKISLYRLNIITSFEKQKISKLGLIALYLLDNNKGNL
jgi:hypothetical protein